MKAGRERLGEARWLPQQQPWVLGPFLPSRGPRTMRGLEMLKLGCQCGIVPTWSGLMHGVAKMTVLSWLQRTGGLPSAVGVGSAPSSWLLQKPLSFSALSKAQV